jgi:hypothetical protein
MKVSNVFLTVALTVASACAHAHADADDQLIAKLPSAKISLLEGIQLAEKTSGPVTSAKFELDDNGNLSLSIYTAPQGLNTPAEANDLTELSGDPTVSPFAPQSEVFKDKEHIARASVHLTLMQMSKLNLSQIIQTATKGANGVAYSVANPEVRNGEPVADVFFLDKHEDSVKITVNMRTGQIVR